MREAARLDSQGKCKQAEPYYQRALAVPNPSPATFNNAGNHYLVCGDPEKARACFQAVLKANPAHPNANLQLAQLAIESKQGDAALRYLAKVPDADPAALLLRAEALHYAGKPAAALETLGRLTGAAKNDPRLLFALGLSAARIGAFDRAEKAFTAVAAQIPADFDVLSNLGRAASRGGHYERAASVLERAAAMKPSDLGVLLELGEALARAGDPTRAVYVLAQARALAPKDTRVLIALAHASEDAGFYGDAAVVYDEYLALRPGDDRTRLDRARVCAVTGTRLDEGLKEMNWYLSKHPEDATGYFYLAQFTWERDPVAAVAHLSSAIKLDPRLAAARYARAWLLQRLGRVSEAAPDLEATVRLLPDNVRALEQLGRVYLTLERPADAEKPLRSALSLNPADREALLHLSQALMALNREAEAQECLERFRKIPVQQIRDPRREPGMIELATLPSAERTRRQIERLRRDAAEHPNQPELQLRLAELLLREASWDEASAAFRELATRNAEGRIWREAGIALARAEKYEMAIEFLKRSPAAHVELALALYIAHGAEQALEVLEQTPENARTGDYWFMKARLLHGAGKNAECEEALQAGLKQSAASPEVTQQAVLMLVDQKGYPEALALSEQALRANPANADLSLARVVLLALMGRAGEAAEALRAVQIRWPEWDRPYIAQALLLRSAGKQNEAKQKTQTALLLNPRACPAEALRDLLLPDCGWRK